MVIWPSVWQTAIAMAPAWGLLAADEPPSSLLTRLDPATRAKVLMALLGIVLLGVALVAFVVLNGRYFRRIARKRWGPTELRQEDWYRKPLTPSDPHDPE